MPQDTLAAIAASSVVRVTADDGSPHYVWEREGKMVAISAVDVVQALAKVYTALFPLGILAVSAAMKRAVRQKLESAPESNAIIVATRGGFERADRPRFYASADGTIISSVPGLKVLFAGKNARFEGLGRFRWYEREMARVIKDQPIPLLVFFYALTPVLQPFAKKAGFLVQNTILEVSGRSSRYKSSITNFVAGSVWGGSSEPLGFADSWNLTPAKAEEIFRDQNYALVVFDEAASAGGSEKDRGQIIGNVVHRLSAGKERGRMGEMSDYYNVMALSNSNESLTSILASAPEVKTALEVRLITLRVPTRETGTFEFVPYGYETVDKAMEDVFKLTEGHRGKLAKRFIADILSWSSRDHEELSSTIRAAVDDFMSRVGLQRANADPVEVRRAKPFALAYASAVLAFRAGTLQKKRWGAVRRTLQRAWFRYGRLSMAGNSPAGLNEFLADQSKLIVDIPLGDRPEIPSKAFSRIDGFIYRDKKHRPYLAMTPSMVSKHLNLTASRLKKLKTEGTLHAGKHLQTRLRLRLEEGREKRESFYLFSITTVPDHAQPFNEGK